MKFMDRLRSKIPTREQIQANRMLAWLAPWLGHAKLWHWSRRGVAMGVSLGVFFGLLVPIAQIPLSVTAAVILRANVPAAAVSTLITNPITFGPIYYAAYKLGEVVTGESNGNAAPPKIVGEATLLQRITAVGKPLMVGLVITAVSMGLTIYWVITMIWRWRVTTKRHNRQVARHKAKDAPVSGALLPNAVGDLS